LKLIIVIELLLVGLRFEINFVEIQIHIFYILNSMYLIQTLSMHTGPVFPQEVRLRLLGIFVTVIFMI